MVRIATRATAVIGSVRGASATALGAAWHAALDATLPPLCPACATPVADAGGLCGPCWSGLSFVTPPLCERLGTPFPHAFSPSVSARAVTHPPAFSRARGAVRYDAVAQTLVHALKYGDRLDLAPMMGRFMATAGRTLLAEADALVPVPLHWRRLWTRRFNQAALLATVMADSSGIPRCDEVLRRVRATPQQVGMTREERAANVQAAFRVPDRHRHAVRGRRLVLVDDVMTTGATADTCARTLLRAGAARVDVIVFALVVNAMPA